MACGLNVACAFHSTWLCFQREHPWRKHLENQECEGKVAVQVMRSHSAKWCWLQHRGTRASPAGVGGCGEGEDAGGGSGREVPSQRSMCGVASGMVQLCLGIIPGVYS